MPFSNYTLKLAVDEIIDRVIGVRIHSADPGVNGTQNEISNANGVTRGSIPAGGWTRNASTEKVENTAAVDMGTASAAAGTAAWYSLWDGANFMARREFAASMVIANAAVVTVLAGTIDLTPSSMD